MNIRILNDVVVRRAIEMNAHPLSRHIIVRQIVEHAIYTITTQHDIGIRCTITNQSSLDINAGIVVEVDGGTCTYRQRSQTVYHDIPIDHQRFVC